MSNVPGTSVAIVDKGAGVEHAEIVRVAAALQYQANNHFAPMPPVGIGCGGGIVVRAAVSQLDLLPHESVMGLRKALDISGALGDHDVAPNGQPFSEICPELDAQDGVPWSTTASHELAELLKDMTCAQMMMGSDGRPWADEPCDAVEADSYAITIDGHKVLVSNFVLAAWYNAAASGKRDYMGLCTHAFEVRPGGYAQYFDPAQGWVQITNFQRAPRSYRLNHRGRRARRQAAA